jgi:CheY-like chemotaxis protein
MPAMSGPALIEELQAQGRQPRVVFMSGYDQDLLRSHVHDAHYLQKPFRPDALLAKVAEAMAAPRQGGAAPQSQPAARQA